MFSRIIILLSVGIFFTSCDFIAQMEEKSREINQYERVALNLSKDNRLLQKRISDLQYEIQELKAKNNFLSLKIEKKDTKKGRAIASVKKTLHVSHDLVKFDTYNWSAKQLLEVASSEFGKKNFEKASQFYQTFLVRFPYNKMISDELLFKAGIAAYQSRNHYDWTMKNLKVILNNYPTSPYYRGAKLWSALSGLKMGDKSSFFSTVEEFRKKYRNTNEWVVLSKHYEDLLYKYGK